MLLTRKQLMANAAAATAPLLLGGPVASQPPPVSSSCAFGSSAYGKPTAAHILFSTQAAGRHLNHVHSELFQFNPTGQTASGAVAYPAVTLQNELAAMNGGYELILNAVGKCHTDLTWPPGGLADIIALTPYVRACFDGWITLINMLPRAVWLRPWREMTNVAANPWTRNATPAQFIDAWQTMYGYFGSNGCTNARFTWCIASHPRNPTDGRAWFPGENAVDWIGADTYSSDNNGFADLVLGLRVWYASFNQGSGSVCRSRPLIVCEMGDSQYDPNRISRTLGILPAMRAYPSIQAVTWWNQPGDQWGIVDTPSGHLAAFQSVFQNPYFGAHVAP